MVSHKNGKAVLKILTDLGKQVESHSIAALDHFNGRGAARLYRTDREALLLEYLEGEDLSHMVKHGNDCQATIALCDLLLELHNIQGPIPENIPTMESRFASLFRRASDSSNDFFYRAASIAEELMTSSSRCVVLHGDIHHNNIIMSKDRGWLSIDPQPVVGESIYDTANIFYNPDDSPEIVESTLRMTTLSEIIADRMKTSKERVLKYAFAHGGLSISWQMDHNENPERRTRIAMLIESLL